MQFRSKIVLLFFAILLPSLAFAAVSASQAVDFVSSENYLNSGETVEIFPVVKISYNGSNYWVVGFVSGNSITGFAAVNADSKVPEISQGKTTNEQVFKTAYFLRSFLKSKENAEQQGAWFFSQQNIDFFNTLSRVLKTEKGSDLAIIISDAKKAPITAAASSMGTDITSLISLSEAVSEKISQALKAESEFFSNPSPKQAGSLAAAFESLKTEVDSLEQKAIAYDSKVSDLKKAIADANLELAQKTALSRLAETPSIFSQSVISAKKQSANSSIAIVQKSLQDSISNSQVFAESFNSRLKRALAYNALYSEDSVLKEKTKYYSTLSLAVGDILSEQNAKLWRSKDEVKNLWNYWASAESAFRKTNYDSAIENAQKAKQSVVLIVKGGMVEEIPEPEYNVEIFYQLAIGAIAVMVLLFFIQKILPKILKKGKGDSMQDLQEEFKVRR